MTGPRIRALLPGGPLLPAPLRASEAPEVFRAFVRTLERGLDPAPRPTPRAARKASRKGGA